MKVYRVEHCITGEGPYNNRLIYSVELVTKYNLYSQVTAFKHSDKAHPCLYVEMNNMTLDKKHIVRKRLDNFLKDSLYGFKSIKQYMKWFNQDERLILYILGYRLETYLVPSKSAIVTDYQVVFDSYAATKISKTEPFNYGLGVTIDRDYIISL